MDSRLFAYNDPKSPISEIFRTLRTNIKFTSFDKNVKTIVFTSTGPNEGKSTIISNLAVTLSQAGNKVLLMEGDLRNPTVHKMFSLPNDYGITNMLIGGSDHENFIHKTDIEKLDVLPCGPKPPNPAELLGSNKMKSILDGLKEYYDYILIDAPPVIVVTDGALLASISDGTILVIASGEATIESVLKARDLLVNVKADIIGTVLNKYKSTSPGNYYYRYGYYYTDRNRSKTKDI
ncbi:tyrosine-protein kinase YwqD [Oxobacter pfennigii]|uniref:non-specific protein-tyrosine kinase n=1 Tax=Oxobacter pfennigii TaxID=36849 RepID=A0A0P8WBQ8_9CLOT|nr:CpsD/CapB family tyrosine-protein kinase [Oxobacter pfennigii]KPU45156.1 tyrosine-protein kinase YwqD [Oxobacter pfennigii]